MEQQQLKNIIEAVLMSADKPMKVNQIEALFAGDVDMPARNDIRKALQDLAEDYKERGFELKEVASGFRIQVGQDYSPWVGRLWEEKPARYTRALLETLALIAYRQPITRGEIEEIRGVSVSSNIIKTLQEREWIKVLGHKDVPGKPALYGTSKEFLDYFNLKSLEDLPTLAELKDLDQIHQELDLDVDNTAEQDNPQQDEQPQDDDGQPPEDAAQAVSEVIADAEGDAKDDNTESSELVEAEADVVVAEQTEDTTAEKPDVSTVEDTESSEQDDDDEKANSGEAEVISITAAENDVVEDDIDEDEAQPQSVAS